MLRPNSIRASLMLLLDDDVLVGARRPFRVQCAGDLRHSDRGLPPPVRIAETIFRGMVRLPSAPPAACVASGGIVQMLKCEKLYHGEIGLINRTFGAANAGPASQTVKLPGLPFFNRRANDV